jgi:hypothetical protein
MPRPTDFLIHICIALAIALVAFGLATSVVGSILSLTLGHALVLGLLAWGAYTVGHRRGRLEEQGRRVRHRVGAKVAKLKVVKR